MPQAQRAPNQTINFLISSLTLVLVSAYLFPELLTDILSLFRFSDPLADHVFPEDTVVTRFDTHAVRALKTYQPTLDVLTASGTDLIHFSPKSDGGLDVPSVAIHLFMSARTLVSSSYQFMMFCGLINAAMPRIAPVTMFSDFEQNGLPFEVTGSGEARSWPGKIEFCASPEFKETALVACMRELKNNKFNGPSYCITINPDDRSKAVPYLRLENNEYINPQHSSNCNINSLRTSNGHANWVARELGFLGEAAKNSGLVTIGGHPDFRLLDPPYATDIARWGLYSQLHEQVLAIDEQQAEAGIDDDDPQFRAAA